MDYGQKTVALSDSACSPEFVSDTLADGRRCPNGGIRVINAFFRQDRPYHC
jgi:hypothetical protein